MRPLRRVARRLVGLRRVYRFVLHVDGVDLLDAKHVDALYNGGCADAIFGCVDGKPYAVFSRRAASAPGAIGGAIGAIEASVPAARVVGIERDECPSAGDSSAVRRVAAVAERPITRFLNARMDAFVVVLNAAFRSRASVSSLRGEDELRLIRGIVRDDIQLLR